MRIKRCDTSAVSVESALLTMFAGTTANRRSLPQNEKRKSYFSLPFVMLRRPSISRWEKEIARSRKEWKWLCGNTVRDGCYRFAHQNASFGAGGRTNFNKWFHKFIGYWHFIFIDTFPNDMADNTVNNTVRVTQRTTMIRYGRTNPTNKLSTQRFVSIYWLNGWAGGKEEEKLNT